MTMIVERGVLDIGNDSSTICGSSAHQLVRSEASNGDVELDKLLDYSDCESSDLLSSGRSPAASANNPTFRSDHVSQYHSIQKLCTPTSASTKSEEGQSKDQCHNSFNFPGVKVKTEMSGYQYFVSSEASEDKRETRSDDDDDDDQQQTGEVLPKRQRMGNPRDDCYIGPSDSQYRPKRKQPQPKHCDEGAAMRTQVSQSVPSRRSIVDSYNGAQTDLLEIKKSLSVFKKRHENIFTESSHKSEAKRNSFENDEDSENPEDDDCDSKLGQLEALTKMLKGEIYQNIELLVDHVVRKFVHKNYQQLNVALHHHKNFSINSDEEVHVHSDEIRQNNASEDSQNDPKFSEVHPFSEKPLNYSLQISGKKEEGSSGQESYKTYLRQLANSSCKTLYPLSSMQNMIPMFVPPFNAGYMFHSPNVYHSLLYHSSQKQQEVLKHDSSAALVSEPEQSEAIPLIVNSNSKKKRTKVTDSRFSPRIRFQLGESSEQSSLFYHSDSIQTCGQAEKRAPSYESKTFQRSHQASRSEEAGRRQIARDEKERDYYKSPFQAYMNSNPKFHDSDVFANIYKQNPSSVPICEDVQRGLGDKFPYQNEHLNKSVLCHIGSRSRSESDEEMNREDSMKLFKDSSRSRGLASSATETSYGDQLMTSTLTPMHLRKAKLMFFYVRYPSSSVLKTYFPDVFFNKNNTAQLIKWFSNFREFYYIQMEKFARQAIAEGIVNVSSLYVNRDSELYRILVLHYNRNNRIEVPENFRVTVQATLREFFKAIQAERDQEQSWKKAIYKVIARLDDVIPEHFKRINWMEELADS